MHSQNVPLLHRRAVLRSLTQKTKKTGTTLFSSSSSFEASCKKDSAVASGCLLLPVMNNNHMSEFVVQLKPSSVFACKCVNVEGEECLSPGIETAAACRCDPHDDEASSVSV